MAPFRPSRSTRSGRPTHDNDVMDGLPIRQWRLEESAVGATPPPVEVVPEKDTIWKELSMPKDSHLYQPWAQQLLRAARAGLINKPRPASTNGSGGSSDEKENGVEGAEDGSKNNVATPAAKGYVARKWSQLSPSQEQPEREYLAKRRKGLPSPYATLAGSVIPQTTTGMRKTKVKKIDGEGNAYVWEVLVPEGQSVDGEIVGDLTLESAAAPIATPAPGTVVEGVGVANADGVLVVTDAAQIKRRPPPPRRKPKKGPGRGRKKVAFSGAEGVSASAEAFEAQRNNANGGPRIQIEGVNGEDIVDTTMGGTQEGDEEDDDGDETDEEGEEGDEEDDREDGEQSVSPQKGDADASATSTAAEDNPTPVAAEGASDAATLQPVSTKSPPPTIAPASTDAVGLPPLEDGHAPAVSPLEPTVVPDIVRASSPKSSADQHIPDTATSGFEQPANAALLPTPLIEQQPSTLVEGPPENSPPVAPAAGPGISDIPTAPESPSPLSEGAKSPLTPPPPSLELESTSTTVLQNPERPVADSAPAPDAS